MFESFTKELFKYQNFQKYLMLPNSASELFDISDLSNQVSKFYNIKMKRSNSFILQNINYCLYALRMVHQIFLQLITLRAEHFDSFNEKHLLLLENYWNNMKPIRCIEVSQLKSIPTNSLWWSNLMNNTNSDSNNIVMDQQPLTITTNRDWTELGFQSRLEPSTDFRGMGLLGLYQLNYFSQARTGIAKMVLDESFNPSRRYFPFSVTGN